MRHALELAVAGILLASGATATELGNSSLVNDDASATSGVSNVMRAGEYDLHRLRGYDAENPITGDAPSVSGYTRLDGQSLTPNLDRLMQRAFLRPMPPGLVAVRRPDGKER